MTKDLLGILKRRMNKQAAIRLFEDHERQCGVIARLHTENIGAWQGFAELVKREARTEFVRRHGRNYGLRFGELRLRELDDYSMLFQWDELSVITALNRHALRDWDQSLYRDVRAMLCELQCEHLRDIELGDTTVRLYRIALAYRNYSRRSTMTVLRRTAWAITRGGVDL